MGKTLLPVERFQACIVGIAGGEGGGKEGGGEEADQVWGRWCPKSMLIDKTEFGTELVKYCSAGAGAYGVAMLGGIYREHIR